MLLNLYYIELKDVVRSYYVSNNIYNSTYMLTKSTVNLYNLYSSVPGNIYATYYDIIEMFDPPYIQRIETSVFPTVSSKPVEFGLWVRFPLLT